MTNLHVLSRQEMNNVNGGWSIRWRKLFNALVEVVDCFVGPDHTSDPGDADRARRNDTLMNCI